MRYLLILLSLLFLSGCGFHEAPVMKVYRIVIPSVEAVSAAKYRHKIVKVSYPVALGEKLNDAMYYSYSLSDRGEYLNSRWSNDAGKMVQGFLIQTLTRAKLFKVAVPVMSELEENFRLESTLFDFSHHIRGEASYAVLSLQFMLVDAESGHLLKTHRFSYREPTRTLNAKGYAEAINRIMVKLSRDLITWLR